MTGREYNNQFSEEELKSEIWKDIPEYEGYYQVSNLGRVKSLDRIVEAIFMGKKKKPVIRKGRILIPAQHTDGHMRVNPCINSKVKISFVHRLVLFAFVPNPDNLPVCCHNDGNPTNNRVENLRWGTCYDNYWDMHKHGVWNPGVHPKGAEIPWAKLNEEKVREIRKLNAEGISQRKLGKIFGVSHSVIRNIIIGKKWKHIK